jgi:hypothetical protein
MADERDRAARGSPSFTGSTRSAAHGLSLRALRSGLVPLPGPVTSSRLRVDLAGLALPNPLGLAAGYDKNAEALAPLMRAGFGFVRWERRPPCPRPAIRDRGSSACRRIAP